MKTAVYRAVGRWALFVRRVAWCRRRNQQTSALDRFTSGRDLRCTPGTAREGERAGDAGREVVVSVVQDAAGRPPLENRPGLCAEVIDMINRLRDGEDYG